jgi:hypothetical protein
MKPTMSDAAERIKYVPIDVQDIYSAVDDALTKAFWLGYESRKEYEAEQAPQPPEVDWSKAPKGTEYHVYEPTGVGYWVDSTGFDDPPYVHKCHWVHFSRNEFSGYELPLGIDWRCTLTSRPQEVTA